MKFLLLTAKILYLFCSAVVIHDFNIALLRDPVILSSSSSLAITVSGYRARVILSGSTNLQYNVLIHLSLLPSSKCLF